jgi:hypothetical protein
MEFLVEQGLQRGRRRAQARDVSELMEITRRWCGYVCPDCRFVFRVPSDHDGRGVVCPSCRRMLKIPTAADVTPPLMAPLRTVAEEQLTEGELAALQQIHTAPDRISPWALVACGLALVSIFALGAKVFLPQKSAGVPPQPVAEAPVLPEPDVAVRSESSIVAELQPLAEKFLTATSVDACLALVRNPALAEARMRGYYPDGKIEALGLREFNGDGEITLLDESVAVKVRTRDQTERSLAFVKVGERYLIDWESWVGWSELTWEKFLATKPTTASRFRVNVFPTEYYNFTFKDDLKWQSYRLDAPDGIHSVYGYVERGSDLAKALSRSQDGRTSAMILALKFPSGTDTRDQVEIVEAVSSGWVEK